MTGKSCTIVAEWVLMAAAALNDVLALKYSERTNHQWLFYFILSGRKAYIKNSKTWIRFVKKKKNKQLTKGNPQQTVLVVCPRSLTHSCSGIIGGGSEKHKRSFEEIQVVLFKKIWWALEHGELLEVENKTWVGRGWVFLLPTMVHPALVSVVKSCFPSVTDGDKLLQLHTQSRQEKQLPVNSAVHARLNAMRDM